MSDKQLDSLKERLAPLSPRKTLEPAQFLTEQVRLDQAAEQSEADTDQRTAAVKRALHMVWPKGRREEYAGQCQQACKSGSSAISMIQTLFYAKEEAFDWQQRLLGEPTIKRLPSDTDKTYRDRAK